MSDGLFDLRHAIQTFLEDKLQGEVHREGITMDGQVFRQADIEVSIDDDKYQITIEEL